MLNLRRPITTCKMYMRYYLGVLSGALHTHMAFACRFEAACTLPGESWAVACCPSAARLVSGAIEARFPRMPDHANLACSWIKDGNDGYCCCCWV